MGSPSFEKKLQISYCSESGQQITWEDLQQQPQWCMSLPQNAGTSRCIKDPGLEEAVQSFLPFLPGFHVKSAAAMQKTKEMWLTLIYTHERSWILTSPAQTPAKGTA